MVDRDPLPHQPVIEAEELGLKDLSEEQLLQKIISDGAEWTDDQRGMVVDAHNLASTLHKDDTHRAKPYIYHLLRNACRATGYLHITDPEIITAIILHDSVEDHPDEIIQSGILDSKTAPAEMSVPEDSLAKQYLALKYVAVFSSPRVAEIVAGMTNPPLAQGEKLSYEEHLQRYIDHVAEEIKNPAVWVGKIVDWGDNGLGIIHSDFSAEPDRENHFARKYGAIMPALEARYYRSDIQAMLDPIAKANVERMFTLARGRLSVIDRPS